MGRRAAAALYVVAMVVTIVAVDVLFFRGRFWLRLAANVVMVLVFLLLYLRLLHRR